MISKSFRKEWFCCHTQHKSSGFKYFIIYQNNLFEPKAECSCNMRYALQLLYQQKANFLMAQIVSIFRVKVFELYLKSI